jgi:hypothetical protein
MLDYWIYSSLPALNLDAEYPLWYFVYIKLLLFNEKNLVI